MKKLRQNVIAMAVIMVLSALMYALIIPWQIKASGDGGFTNRTFPRFTMIIIFLASAAGFADALVKALKAHAFSKENREEKSPFAYSKILPWLGFLAVLGYALLFWFIGNRWRGYGFIISTIVFIPVFLLLLRCRKWQYYAATYAFAAVMYVIFRYVLKVMLR